MKSKSLWERERKLKSTKNMEYANIEDQESEDAVRTQFSQFNSSFASNQKRHSRGLVDFFFFFMPNPEATLKKRKLVTSEDSEKVMEHS